MFSRCTTPLPTPSPTPTPFIGEQEPYCPVKLTPLSIQREPKFGNNGYNFLLKPRCRIGQVYDENNFCFLAHEIGNDPGTDSPIITETYNLLAAPCLTEDNGEEVCYLAIEEDGITNFERDENSDFFSVACVNL